MSIYAVRFSEWFKPGPEDEYGTYENAQLIVRTYRCHACGKRLRWRKAVGHHSLPWGYGEIWCGWKCCNSGKIARPDRRRLRRLRRQLGRYGIWTKFSSAIVASLGDSAWVTEAKVQALSEALTAGNQEMEANVLKVEEW